MGRGLGGLILVVCGFLAPFPAAAQEGLGFVQTLTLSEGTFSQLELELSWTGEELFLFGKPTWDLTGLSSLELGGTLLGDPVSLSGAVAFTREGFQEARTGFEAPWGFLSLQGGVAFGPEGLSRVWAGAQYTGEALTVGGTTEWEGGAWSERLWAILAHPPAQLLGAVALSGTELIEYRLGLGALDEGYAVKVVGLFSPSALTGMEAELSFALKGLEFSFVGTWAFVPNQQGEPMALRPVAFAPPPGSRLSLQEIQAQVAFSVPLLQSSAQGAVQTPGEPLAVIARPSRGPGGGGAAAYVQLLRLPSL